MAGSHAEASECQGITQIARQYPLPPLNLQHRFATIVGIR